MLNAFVVGCGLSGAVVARELAEKGYKVKIFERRNHIGGNMFDYLDEHGILVHKYGPHTFHTNKKELYDYIAKYAEWSPFYLTCGAEINGKCTPTPFNYKTIDDFYPPQKAEDIKASFEKCFPARKSVTVVEALECEDELIREYAQFLFDNDYSLYTAKQWGVPADTIDPSVLKRVPLRIGYGEGYFDDSYQVMPKKSYTNFFEKLLNHSNIEVILGVEALEHLSVDVDNKCVLWDEKIVNHPIIYTGALDELFDSKYGQLPYRSLVFKWVYENIESKQAMPVVAYPQVSDFIRIIEYKKLPTQDVQGTTYEVEYSVPYKQGEKREPYYPVITEESQKLYSQYIDLARKVTHLYVCGRLGNFKYYNMDEALEYALQLAQNVLEIERSRV